MTLTLQAGSRPVPNCPDYVLIRKLGAGAFGEVWRARGPGGLDVALKFIPVKNGLDRELGSLEAVRGIRHPNLVSLFGAWGNDDWLILAMELCDCTLQDRLAEAKHLKQPGIPLEELLSYMSDAAKGLDALSAGQVQHRDVKPANLLLQNSGVKLSDFGLAKVLEKTVATCSSAGTIAYSAPEFFNEKIAQQSDQYSLGITYYHLRTGHLLFEGNQAQLVYKHLYLDPDLSALPIADERTVLARALSKEPGKRWPNCRTFANELVKALQRAMEEKHPTSQPIPAPEATADTEVIACPSPKCNQRLRVPKDKRVLTIRCPICGHVWDRPPRIPWGPQPTDPNEDICKDEREYLQALKTEKVKEFLATNAPGRIQRWKEAAQAGLGAAQNLFGLSLWWGIGVPQNLNDAFLWCRKAANQGHAGAQFNLGALYENGHGVAKDETRAAAWYGKAAEQGNAFGQFALGVSYANGQGVSKDDSQAAAWFRKAAEQGHASAQFCVGVLYDNGRGVPKDEAQAAAWFRKAAEQGHADGQFNLGVAYDNGRGVPKDESQAVAWHRKAAEQGHADAQFNLGVAYANGQGVSKDDSQAAAWFRKAAEQGYASAQFCMGVLYDNGRAVPKDESQAVAWYRKAAEQGHADCQFNLGVAYLYGRGVSNDYLQAVAWFRRAAEQGHASAQLSMGVMYHNGRGVPKDEAQAVAWHRKAAEQGHADAQFNLGVAYANGQGVSKDDSQAAAWFRKAAEQGHADGQFNLGVAYAYGRGVSNDYLQAVAWFRRAAAQEHASAQLNLGVMYANGWGVPKDEAQAVAWYRKAAEQGNCDAQSILGEMNANRRGVPKDDVQVETREIISNSLGMKFAWIPPGMFYMGSPKTEADRGDDETQHKVTLSKGFYMGVHQVTQEQWQALMGSNPSYFKGENNLPVEQVSWEDCQQFLKRLSDREGQTYRLPTEAEWEYACRAGTTTPFSLGGTISPDQVNYDGSYPYGNGKKGVYRQKTTPVESFPANFWGLFNMHGNVWEWCEDRYDDRYYTMSPECDPVNLSVGSIRVMRGGGWRYGAQDCRSASRGRNGPGRRSGSLGFRVALVPSGGK